jgi:glucokinase
LLQAVHALIFAEEEEATRRIEGARMKRFAVAVDLGGTNMRTAAVGTDAEIWIKHKEPTEVGAGKAAVLDQLVRTIQRLILEARGANGQAVGVGVGTPGAIQLATGVVTDAPNLPDWHYVPLREVLTARLPLPVWIENDANAAALGEHWAGAAQGVENLICLTLGTGVGGGIILDGKLWRGVDGTAGEIGHMSLDPVGPLCTCGRTGCLEAYASATGIVRMAREAMGRGVRTRLRDLTQAQPADLTAALVYRAAMDGDRLARRVLQRMGWYLGIALANLLNLLNVELIVLSGGVTEAWDLFIDSAETEMRRRAFEIPARRARLVRAMWGDEAGLLGAASLVWRGVMPDSRLGSTRAR